MPNTPTPRQLAAKNAELLVRLNEAEEALRAIRQGEVDALVMSGTEGDHIQTLEGAQEPYRVMVEAMGEGAVTLTEDGTILYCNGRFAERVKVPIEQIVGLPLQGLLAEQDRKRFAAMLVQGAQEAIREALTLQLADGSRLPVLLSMSPLPQSEGKVISVIIADLSDVVAANEARSRLALIVDSSDDAIVSIALNGVIESWNRAAEELFGYTTEEALGHTLESLIVPPEQINEVVREIEAIRRGERTLSADTLRQRKDGTQIEVSIKASPIFDDAGNVVGASINSRDITARKRAEQAAHEIENQLHSITAAAQDAIIMLDNGGRISYWNPAAEKTFGYPASEAMGQPMHDLLAPERFHDASRKGYSHFRESGDGPIIGKTVEVSGLRKDGTEFPLELSLSSVKRKGQWNAIGIIRDITERRQAELEVQRFRQLIDESNDAVLVIDPDDARILDVNTKACSSLGYSRDELLTMYIPGIEGIIPDYFSWNAHVETVKNSGAMMVDGTHRRKDGSSFPVEVSVKYVALKDGSYMIAIARDVTERKKAEIELKQSESRFRGIFEQAAVGVAQLAPDGTWLDVNNKLCDIVGYTYEGLLSKTFQDITHPDDLEADLAYVNQLLEDKIKTYSMEKRYFKKNGDIVWVNLTVSLVRDINNNPDYFISIIEDITEKKHSNLLLQESRNFLKLIIEESPYPMWISDSHGTLITINKSCRKLLNITEEEVVGKYNALKDNMVIEQGRLPLVESVYQNGKKVNFRIAWAAENLQGLEFSASAPVILDVTITPIVDENGNTRNAIYQHIDITEAKKAEAKIKYLNRVYAVLSGINSLIVHVSDREELFREACNIAVEKGEFHAAMLLTVDPSTGQTASLVTAGMEDNLLSAAENTLSTSEGVQSTFFARSIKEKRVVVSNDVIHDPKVLLRKECEESGVRSLIALPLIVAGEAVGVIALYASETEFFQEDEIKLLAELASDIAFAIDHIDKLERINYLAYYDELTGLANRALFFERLTQYIHSAASGRHKLAIGMIDLERFKNLNDSLGRAAGDSLLMQVAEWLTHRMGDANLLARIDADHFAILLPKVKSDRKLARMIEDLIAVFKQHQFSLNGAIFKIGIKVGIALYPNDGDDADILFRNAEAALKKAKAEGDRYLFYTKKMMAAVAGKLALENQLRQAIDNEEFVLHYQPKVNLVSGKVTGAEALIRWHNPKTGLVPPGEFIPILEETGMIYEVGRWALGKAMTDYLHWRDAGLAIVPISVNVSPLQLSNINFIEEIRQVIAIDIDVAAGLDLEITESVIMNNMEFNVAILQEIRNMGVTIAIDDFGTGFSSLSYLAKLPADTLKIDRMFVNEMVEGPVGLALVSTIIHLAHSLNLKVVAEGVETEEQSKLLRLLDCDEIQGFLFSKPVPSDIFEAKFLA